MADLSASEISTRFELQKRVERELRDRIAEYELKIIEGDRLRKKLHNDIQVIFLNLIPFRINIFYLVLIFLCCRN